MRPTTTVRLLLPRTPFSPARPRLLVPTMRFSTTLLAPVLLLLSSANALSTKAQRYDLKASKSADHVLDLNSQEFDDLISREGRDFSISVLLTALEPGFKVCRVRRKEGALSLADPPLHSSTLASSALLACESLPLPSAAQESRS